MARSPLYYKSGGTPGSGSPLYQAPGSRALYQQWNSAPSSTKSKGGSGSSGDVAGTGFTKTNEETSATFRPGMRFGNYNSTMGLTVSGDLTAGNNFSDGVKKGFLNKGGNIGLDWDTSGGDGVGFLGNINAQYGIKHKGTPSEILSTTYYRPESGPGRGNPYNNESEKSNYIKGQARIGFGQRAYSGDGEWNVSAVGDYNSEKKNKYSFGVGGSFKGFNFDIMKNTKDKGVEFKGGLTIPL